jgi:RNA polymerase sigma-70 factor (ECF subfamily)
VTPLSSDYRDDWPAGGTPPVRRAEAFSAPLDLVPARVRPDPLLPRIAAGDPTAVRECIARYGPLVLALARRAVGTGPDAEDAVQDVFVELWKSARRFDPTRSSEPTFVTTVARRRVLDLRRRTSLRPPASPLPDALADPRRDAADETDLADEVAFAGRALAQLPADQQHVIRLAICQGWTHEQIATGTGTPLGTVKTLIRRGLIEVREILTAHRPERRDA